MKRKSKATRRFKKPTNLNLDALRKISAGTQSFFFSSIVIPSVTDDAQKLWEQKHK